MVKGQDDLKGPYINDNSHVTIKSDREAKRLKDMLSILLKIKNQGFQVTIHAQHNSKLCTGSWIVENQWSSLLCSRPMVETRSDENDPIMSIRIDYTVLHPGMHLFISQRSALKAWHAVYVRKCHNLVLQVVSILIFNSIAVLLLLFAFVLS